MLLMLLMLDTSKCCFLPSGEKLSREVDFEPRVVRLDEVLVKFSETHQTSDGFRRVNLSKLYVLVNIYMKRNLV